MVFFNKFCIFFHFLSICVFISIQNIGQSIPLTLFSHQSYMKLTLDPAVLLLFFFLCGCYIYVVNYDFFSLRHKNHCKFMEPKQIIIYYYYHYCYYYYYYHYYYHYYHCYLILVVIPSGLILSIKNRGWGFNLTDKIQ